MVATGLTFSNHNINTIVSCANVVPTTSRKRGGVPGLTSIHQAYIDTIANAVPR